MKLARILAKQWACWPAKYGAGLRSVDALSQGMGLAIYANTRNGNGYGHDLYQVGQVTIHAEDAGTAFVTRADWDLERKRVIAESWYGHPDTDPPMHAFCNVIEGGADWGAGPVDLIGKRVEVIGSAVNTFGNKVFVVESDGGTTFTLIRQCLERGKSQDDLDKEADLAKEIESLSISLFNDCRGHLPKFTPWAAVAEDIRVMYRNAIKADWRKP